MRVVLGAALALAAIARGAAAQNEGALRAAFEGKTVTARIDMPATSQGVDVYPLDQAPLNFRDVAQRLKDHGTAVRMGQPVMVTKVVVKKNSHIEFQLGGGGYGTFGDWAGDGSSVSVVNAGETKGEKALRDSIKATSDKGQRQRLQRELDGLRSARERENARGAAEAQQANIARETLLRAKRAESGSRFNVRFRQGIPPEQLTPDGVMRALAQYLDFGAAAPTIVAAGTTAGTTAGGAPAIPAAALRADAPAAAPAATTAAAAPGGIAALRKGLTVEQVEALLGPAATAAEVKDGTLAVTKRTYRRDGMQVAARFVGGVMIDFTITPQ
ncbi:MAG: hypothetical protein ACXWZS_09945 [Gemmatirosa sp.]